MGCGISTMHGNDTSPGRHYFKGRFRHQNIVASPIVKSNDNMYTYEPINDDGENQESVRRDEGFNGDRLKDKKINEDRRDQEEMNERKVFINPERQGKLKEDNASNNKNNVGTNHEEDNNNNSSNNNKKKKDDWFIGPGSPSFREYCNDNDLGDRCSMGDSNDYPQSGESTKNSSDEDSTKPVNGHSKKQEAEKKERKGRGGFRNVMHKGKGRGGKRNILNFGCYNSNTQSCAEGSFNKVVEKDR
ncbi:unnamed protein product [Vicia faba]|uniref:Uncharacterized protein n=1 Tax=Vicia faba TaxID=3906 RepID=A0AAV1ASL8_VICFA|nr:unnamed protein product [Vicia faba]